MSKQFCVRQRLPTPVACVVRLHYIQAKDFSVGVPVLAENELSVFSLWWSVPSFCVDVHFMVVRS